MRRARVRLAGALVLWAACASTAPPPDTEPAFPVAFEGLQQVSEASLRAAARRELASFQAEGFRPADAADAADAMLMDLQDRGYAHAEVAFDLDRERLLFRVVEGARTYLGAVGFDGAESFGEADLLEFFRFPGADLLGTGRPLFRLSEVETAAAKVERYYLLNGFYRVRVEAPQITWTEDRTVADVTIPVTEGRRYTVTLVEFDGIAPRELELVGAPYHARLAVEAAAKLRGELLREGYQFCEVDAVADVDDDAAAVAIRFTVVQGPPVRLREVRFEGNERSRRSFLRRRLPLEDAELILQELHDEGIANLYRTGLFSSVRSRLDKVGEDLADLEILLKEVQARSLDFELGYGSYELARGAVRYRDRNLFGWGRRLETEIRGSVRSGAFRVSVEDPHLLGERTPLEVITGYSYRVEPSFDRQTIGAEILVSRHLRGLRLRGGYRFKTEEAINAKVQVDPEEEGFIRTAGIFAGVRRDTRDSLFAPTRGWLGDLGVSWSSEALGADLNFLELDAGSAFHLRVPGGFVLVLGSRFRTREILDDRADLPVQERFFLGGASDVRSFGQSELGPVETGEPRGGLTVLHAMVEVRRQIKGPFHAAVFYDVGIVDAAGWSLSAPVGHGVGIGFRYMLPIGPIRLDIAYNPRDLFAADRRWQFHLAVGFTF